MVDALQFSYFLTVAQVCFDNGSNSSFMLDGCDACARVTMGIGGAGNGARGGDIGGGAVC